MNVEKLNLDLPCVLVGVVEGDENPMTRTAFVNWPINNNESALSKSYMI